MGKRSVQLNIRTEATVAQALREEALRRDVALGDVLEELLVRARASTNTGVWIALPPEVESALKGVAASRGLEASQVLAQMVAGELREQLLSLAANLRGPAGAGRQPLKEPLQTRSSEGQFSLGSDEGDLTPSASLQAGPASEPLSGQRPEAPAPRRRRNPAQGLPVLGEEDEDEEVGIFTVFE